MRAALPKKMRGIDEINPFSDLLMPLIKFNCIGKHLWVDRTKFERHLVNWAHTCS